MEGYRIHWIVCRTCRKEILRFREVYGIDPSDLHKHIPKTVEIISFEPCEHHSVIKTEEPPELYEFRVGDYYIVPK